MKHIKLFENFVNEEGEWEYFLNALGGGNKSKESSKKSGSKKSNSPLSVGDKFTTSSRNDEFACKKYDCWTHFGGEKFWNGKSKIGGKTVPEIKIERSPNSFSISYDGPASGFLLKHGKGGKGDTIHQTLNVLTLELNQYLQTLSAKPDVKNIKMELAGKKLTVTVPLSKVQEGTHYSIERRGGLGHGGDFSGLEKYKGKKGYEEATHRSGKLTEKFVTFIS